MNEFGAPNRSRFATSVCPILPTLIPIILLKGNFLANLRFRNAYTPSYWSLPELISANSSQRFSYWGSLAGIGLNRLECCGVEHKMSTNFQSSRSRHLFDVPWGPAKAKVKSLQISPDHALLLHLYLNVSNDVRVLLRRRPCDC